MKIAVVHDIEVPKEIRDAALTLDKYAMENGWKDWELFGVASRDLVNKLRSKISAAKITLEE